MDNLTNFYYDLVLVLRLITAVRAVNISPRAIFARSDSEVTSVSSENFDLYFLHRFREGDLLHRWILLSEKKYRGSVVP